MASFEDQSALLAEKGRTREGDLVRIERLRLVFGTYRGPVFALNGVDFQLRERKITGLVGETGCGKSITARTILRLLPPNVKELSGHVWFDGRDILRMSEKEAQRIRGKEIAMVFQNPRGALNPVFKIGKQLEYVLRQHLELAGKGLRMRCLELLRMVQVRDPDKVLRNYPFELSTGMCQRIMIAMAIACRPRLILADEPTTALDVTIQAQILDLLVRLVYEEGITMLLISHDLGVISETCDWVGVMYAGQIVEFGCVREIIGDPLHPYTRGLLRASLLGKGGEGIYYIPGHVPSLHDFPGGCLYKARCDLEEECSPEDPPFVEIGNGHMVRCWKCLNKG